MALHRAKCPVVYHLTMCPLVPSTVMSVCMDGQMFNYVLMKRPVVMSGITLDSSSTLSSEAGSLNQTQSSPVWPVLPASLLWGIPLSSLSSHSSLAATYNTGVA